MNDSSFEIELKKTFLIETEEMLGLVESIFIKIESNPTDISSLDQILRLVHTIKGSGLVVGFDQLGHFTHKFENLLVEIRDKKIKVTESIVELLFAASDCLKDFVATLKNDLFSAFDCSKIENKIDEALAMQNKLDSNSVKADVFSSKLKGAHNNKDKGTTNAEQQSTKNKFKGTVLICDDETEILNILEDILQEENYQVFKVDNAIDAFKFLEKQTVDFLMSDLKMSKMDGMEYITKVRQKNNYIPIILVSGHYNMSDFKHFFALGVNDFVNKPFTAEDILITAERAMKTKTLWDALMSLTRICFQSYASIQNIISLFLEKNLDEMQKKEYKYLTELLEEMRKTTMVVMNSEKKIKK